MTPLSEQSNDSNRWVGQCSVCLVGIETSRQFLMHNGMRHGNGARLIDMELDKPLADTDVANPPSTPTSTDTKIDQLVDKYCTPIVEHGIYTGNILTKDFVTALKTLLTSEKNKAVELELETLMDWYMNAKIRPYVGSFVDQIRDRLTQLREME